MTKIQCPPLPVVVPPKPQPHQHHPLLVVDLSSLYPLELMEINSIFIRSCIDWLRLLALTSISTQMMESPNQARRLASRFALVGNGFLSSLIDMVEWQASHLLQSTCDHPCLCQIAYLSPHFMILFPLSLPCLWDSGCIWVSLRRWGGWIDLTWENNLLDSLWKTNGMVIIL